jgi:hypothetical protein
MFRQHPSFAAPLTKFAGTAFATILVGWAVAVAAQTTSQPAPPPQQAAAPPANSSTTNLPPMPLGQGGVQEVQAQLIALGFDPGPADGQAGPATLGAAQQYNESRGGSGPVPIDAALLARLQQDTGPRLTPEQVAARAQPHYQAPAASNPLTNMMQQFESNLRQLFNGGP